MAHDPHGTQGWQLDPMPPSPAASRLPDVEESLLVRTDFSDDRAWLVTRDAAMAVSSEGFQASLRSIDDPAWSGRSWQELRREAQRASDDPAMVLFIVDAQALDHDHPILVVDVHEEHPPFRCIAAEVWAVENNLNLATMDWEDFADNCDPDGVHRGFPV